MKENSNTVLMPVCVLGLWGWLALVLPDEVSFGEMTGLLTGWL